VALEEREAHVLQNDLLVERQADALEHHDRRVGAVEDLLLGQLRACEGFSTLHASYVRVARRDRL
jgi:hypothetical protein